MKKSRLFFDGLLVGILTLLSLAAFAPGQIVMPSTLQMFLFFLAFGLVSAFAVIVWREKPADEREAQHLLLASRLAYIAGCGVLIVGLLVEAFRHDVDPIIPVALLVMIGSRLGAQWLQDKK